ncbi:phthalate 4,5-dioxygenase reductase subunit [Rhodobium orientis]|uniref:Ferredoxin n=1 Tax=Rhodobium orientis TaxID=34017 RepID=A0A327JQN1_9HYPH|nr:PDR/VanB family oxidoreductase [Rhodobium orientis]MBB4302511.1 phthalate 4,5-dioxygenase reductase subunit [Rhodobium orientis]MBK5949360.1 ferredoxin [Rhodobium orientis]RAI28597.1 ferredoxin [Rhodobium orientis]
MRIKARRKLTPEIDEFTLVPEGDTALPSFTPGAHITVETPDGAMRRYSLVNDGQNPQEYVIAIKREPDSRGGSSSMHEKAVEGTTLTVEAPENEFELVDADKYLLIAGGIGITPILAMARHLFANGKPFEVIYCARTAEDAAYLDEISAFEHATTHHDQGDLELLFDFWDRLEKPGNEHVYCCGPAPLMEEIKGLTGHWSDGHVHFEDFNPVDVVRADDVPFKVTLAKTGRTVEVPADRSILEALRDAGLHTVSSCESGTCGTCKCGLIEGEVDHRDHVLMDEEKSDHIMICVSRAKSGDLTIDL